MSLELLILAFLLGTSLAFLPGQDSTIARISSHHPNRLAAVWLNALGLCSGIALLTIIVAVFAVIAEPFRYGTAGLRLVSTSYFVYLAYCFLRPYRPDLSSGSSQLVVGPDQMSFWALFRRAFLLNIGNYKVAMFVLLSLLVVDPSRGSVASDLMMLGTVYIGATAFVLGLFPTTAAITAMRIQYWAKEAFHAPGRV